MSGMLFQNLLNSKHTHGMGVIEDKMITVSENAKQHVLSLIASENSPEGTFIRVGVEGGGCSGLTYKLVFDNVITETDKIFEDKGIKIAVDKKSFLYLIGTELDYVGGLNGKGFVFVNPNASRTCGCGESFGV
jgi:iron-sulfur cluster assembly protein